MEKMRRSKLALEAERTELEARIGELKVEGEYLMGVRLEKAAAGGTASKKAQGIYKYARLRSGKGKFLANGQRSQYVPLKEIPYYEILIARGKHIAQLEKRLAVLVSD
jgi:hypothetical protein